ncbi:MAG: sulfite exporter TauE/SafE family protein [Microthrixaceae bacterium]
MTVAPMAVAALALACAFGGSLGGIGGATLLVPVLLALGVDPRAAAPIGLVTVAAGSLASASRPLQDGLVHHRLGLTVELAASSGAVAGALLSASVPEVWLARVLGIAALIGAVAALARTGIRNRPDPLFGGESAGEWPGTLGGQYSLDGEMVPYQARNLPGGLAASLVAGVVAGLSGVGGGFLKTPAMSEIMKVPVKVAAATTTFTLGITATTGLVVYAEQGRVEPHDAAAALLGALVGGVLGARTQARIHATTARRVTGGLLLVVAAVVIGRTLT